jgi:hypothetical protein
MYLKVKDSFKEPKQDEARRQAARVPIRAARRTLCALALSRWRLGAAHGQSAFFAVALNYTRENGGVKWDCLWLPVCAFLFAAQSIYAFANLTPQAMSAFDRYVDRAEARMKADLQPARFLHADAKPELRAKLRGGELVIDSASTLNGGNEEEIPGGMIQDWRGMMFIPGTTLQDVEAVLQDYANYKNFYKPKVIESKELAHNDDAYDVFLRLHEKHLFTVVLNTTYHVRYGMLDSQRMYVTSRSTRIAEAKDPKKPTEEYPGGNDRGFLWRLNSYWRFEAADGGVYAECEAISLSRDVPLGLGWMIKGFLESFPKESMMNTLRGTRAAVAARTVSSPASAH